MLWIGWKDGLKWRGAFVSRLPEALGLCSDEFRDRDLEDAGI